MVMAAPKQTNSTGRKPHGLVDHVVWRSLSELKEFPGNPRRHPEAQIRALMKSIQRFWTNPILVDEIGTILAGHGRWEAAKRLGMTKVPTVTVSGLSDSEKRAVVIADNRLPEQAVWDFDLLRGHFRDLIKMDFDVELTGFSTGEIDLLMDGVQQQSAPADLADDLTGLASRGPAISQLGDVWQLSRHRLACGDAQRRETYEQLLGDARAEMMVTDPLSNVGISGHAVGRGKVRRRQFAMGSGAMPPAALRGFLHQFISCAISCSGDGAIHYIFTDWPHLHELLGTALPLYSEWKNLLVWNKSTAGQGSFYQTKHELIAVFKSGAGSPINNFEPSGQGRYRTNVLDYANVNSLDPARRGDLELRPTPKPTALIADLIRDCSRRNGVILDPFGGSGTTVLAAERTGRIARAVELDPLYVDLAIRRFEKLTGIQARHANTGLSFTEAEARQEAPSPSSMAKRQ
jgi:ParB-like chromosome segregation protein Spo0J